MTPYAVKVGDITPNTVCLFLKMKQVVEIMDDFTFGTHDPLSCHHICHALRDHFPVDVEDGSFGTSFQHSWLVLARDKEIVGELPNRVIADMYPVGGAASFLVYAHYRLPWHGLYQPGTLELVTKKIKSSTFKEQVAQVSAHVGMLLASTNERRS